MRVRFSKKGSMTLISYFLHIVLFLFNLTGWHYHYWHVQSLELWNISCLKWSSKALREWIRAHHRHREQMGWLYNQLKPKPQTFVFPQGIQGKGKLTSCIYILQDPILNLQATKFLFQLLKTTLQFAFLGSENRVSLPIKYEVLRTSSGRRMWN